MDSVCRTCLAVIKNSTLLHHLNHSKPTNDLNNREKLEACVPELTLDIVLEPVICNTCKENLAIAYYFKNQCLETEKTLFNFFQRRKQNQNCTDLLNNYDLLALVKDDIILEHSYSTFNQVNGVEYLDEGEKSHLALPTCVQSSLHPIVEKAKETNLCCDEKPKPTDEETALEAICTIANYETIADYDSEDTCAIEDNSVETIDTTEPSLHKIVKSQERKNSPKKNKPKTRRLKKNFFASPKRQKKHKDVNKTTPPKPKTVAFDLVPKSIVVENVGNCVTPQEVKLNRVGVPESTKQNTPLLKTESKRQKRKQLQPKKVPQEQNSDPKVPPPPPQHKENGVMHENKENECKNDKHALIQDLKMEVDMINGLQLKQESHTPRPPVKVEKSDDRRKPKLTYRSKKRYQCTKCDKNYNYRCHFDVHLKSHIFKKLYSCPVCDKSFSQDKYLRAHRLMHTKRALFRCSLCTKCLSTRTALQRHITTHTGNRPFSCALCNKRFSQKIQLSVHQRTHTGMRPFKCNICSAMFTQKSHLLGHMRIHTGEKPFECDKCPKRFPKSNALRIHLQCHDNKPHQCSGCNKLFKDLCSYKKHVKKNLAKCVSGRRLFKAEKLKAKAAPPKPDILEEINNDIQEINMGIASIAEDCMETKKDVKRLKYICKVCRKGFTTNFSRNRHAKYQHIAQK